MTPRRVSVPTPSDLQAAAIASRETTTQWEIAFHEASHVVVEIDVARSFPDTVFLNDGFVDDPDVGGQTQTRTFFDLGIAVGQDHHVDPRVVAYVEGERRAHAAVAAAGDIGTSIARGNVIDHSDHVIGVLEEECVDWLGTDNAKLRRLVEGMSYADAERWLETAFVRAERSLRERWDDVELLAANLIERRHLDREALWDLFPDD